MGDSIGIRLLVTQTPYERGGEGIFEIISNTLGNLWGARSANSPRRQHLPGEAPHASCNINSEPTAPISPM